MATSADLNWEENLIARWMSDVSRAGVILNSAFPSLKTTRPINTDNASKRLAVNVLNSSNNTSLSEDSLYREQALESCSPCEEKLDTAKTLFPISLAKTEQMLMVEDAPACWEAPQTDFKHDQLGGLDEEYYGDQLLHKLEQLKGLQQHKQEQRKRQQVEEIQRLVEQQQKILSKASDQQGHTDLMGSSDGDTGCEGTENENASENLAEEKCFEALNAEERPIPASIQERKQTFEEFLEEQIRLEEQRLSQKGNLKDIGRSTSQKPVTKRPFLKRGEGLTRFTNAKSKVAKQKESKVPLHPNTSEIKNTVKADKPQLHRKIVAKSKEQSSDNFVSKSGNQLAKSKKGFALPARKTAVLRNCTGKSILPSTRSNPNENKLGQLKDSIRPETNGERDENKESILELARLNETDRKLLGEKHKQPGQLTKAVSHSKCLTNCFEKDPELSFELSFQKKLENWDTDIQQEQIELDEFLFLEQAADEISFASNSSVIIKILDQGHQISKGHRMSSTPIKSGQQQMNGLDVTAMNNRNGEMFFSPQTNNEGGRQTNSQAPATLKDHQHNSEMCQAFSNVEFQGFKNTEWEESESDGSSDMTSESEEEFEITIKPASEEAKMLPLSNGGDSSKLSEGRGLVKPVIVENRLDLLEKDLIGDHSNEVITNEAVETQSMFCANRNTVEFDDERSWSDFEKNGSNSIQEPKSDMISKVPLSTDCSARSEAFLPDKVIKRKIAVVKKGDIMPKQSVTESEMTPPPTTELMLKLFPSLKPKKVDMQPRHDAKPIMGQEEPGDSARSQLLREKLVELELEIERFKVENASLTKLREEREIALENLRKEIADFEQQKTKELTRIEEFKKEETRKLQKERKVFEKYTLAARAIPDKRERDEIQALKQQLATLQEDLKRREAKWFTTHARLRDQIETLTKENTQLREEIKIMERFRLEAWKRKEASSNKRKIDGCGIYSQRTESSQLPAVLQKSQTLYSVPQEEKSSRTNGKSDCPNEGKHFARPILASARDENYLDNMAMTLEDSSKRFMANLPGNGPAEPSTSMAPDAIDSEEETEREITHPDGRVEKILKGGSQLIIFPNGTRKEVSCDGKTTTVTFFNGDIKQVLEDQRVIYYYADAKTTHTTYPNSLEVLHFSNGQIEKHFPDGRKEVAFPDQTIMNVFPDGREETIHPDGTIVRIQQDRSKIIEFNNGQQELHTAHFKRREYPDGSIKTVYANGRQETKYASGRIRVKDKDGSVIIDTLP
ncbi:centromere protein J [Tiliqua scincoides]|uniref:centromere protein J n=1 Tax=Tiliqua scincoides TaxID=71010 RepID=UPI003461C44C